MYEVLDDTAAQIVLVIGVVTPSAVSPNTSTRRARR